MSVSGEVNALATVAWQEPTAQALRCWNDDEVATEHGAYGVAAILISHVSDLQVVERSKKRTGFDFWLGAKDTNEPLFQKKARLEVSGIRSGSETVVHGRVRQKLTQTDRSDGQLGAYVIVVEFGSPKSRVAKKWIK